MPNAATKNALTTEFVEGEDELPVSRSHGRDPERLRLPDPVFSCGAALPYLLKTPAGSMRVTFRIAVMAAKMHMPTVSANR